MNKYDRALNKMKSTIIIKGGRETDTLPKAETKFISCNFTEQKIYDLIIKNPHCAQYFCNVDNTKVCKQNKCDECNNLCLVYKKDIRDILTKGLPIEKYKIMENFYVEELPWKLKIDGQYDNDIRYQSLHQLLNSVTHIGQLKLFLSELLFLTLYIDNPLEEFILIYAGAARGEHTPLLLDFFPNITFYVYDANKFCMKINEDTIRFKINLFSDNGYFTDDVCAKLIAHLDKYDPDKRRIFVSDIRLQPKDEEVMKDQDWQQNWVKMIRPFISSLKFRLAYDENPALEYEYLKGEIYMQHFAPVASTETRLHVMQKDISKSKIYKPSIYNNNLYFFNRYLRSRYYEYPENFNLDRISKFGFDHCYDCVSFINIVNDYFKKYNKKYHGKTPIYDHKGLINTIIYIINNVYEEGLSHFVYHINRPIYIKIDNKYHKIHNGRISKNPTDIDKIVSIKELNT